MKFAPALLLVLLLGAWGCATTESLRAYDGVSSVYPQAIREISWQTARAMADRYPAGQTTLQLITLPGSSFSPQFESDLRALGFSVSSDPDMIGIDILQVGYILDVLEGRTCYLDLRVSDGNRLARTYKITATGVVAGAGTATSNWPATSPSSPRESNATIRNALDNLPPAGGIRERTLTDDSAPASSTASAPASYSAPSQLQAVTATPEPPAPAPVELQKTPQAPTPPPVAVSSPAPAAEAPASSSASVTPATPAAPAPEAPVPLLQEQETTQESWKIEPGPLQPQVEQWASRAGYQVVWKSPHDYEMQSNCVFREDFIGAIKQLFRSMQQSGNALHVALYQANHVLVVTED